MKKSASKKQEELPDLFSPGELFIRETYLRMHRQKRGMTTEDAAQKLSDEIRLKTVVVHGNRAEVVIYRKV